MRAISLILGLTCLTAAPVAQRAPDVDGGRVELAELQGLLRLWTQRADWPELKPGEDMHPMSVSVPGDPTPEISSRLASFSSQFGLQPRECPGWMELSNAATEVYEVIVGQHPFLDVAPKPGERWFEPGWISVRALLLDISGHSDEANALLFGESRRTWPGCCPPCLSESLFFIARARSEFLDRAGDAKGALLWLHEAWYQNTADELAGLFGRLRDVKGLMGGRYAVLLAESGEGGAAGGVLRLLEGHAEASLGLSIARATLGDRTPATAASEEIVFAVPLHDDTSYPWSTPGMAYVSGNRGNPNSWQLLACRLPRHPERHLANRSRPDYAEDLVVLEPDDPRVLPFVERCTDQRAGWRWAPALEVQRALGRPLRERLIECLQRTDIDDSIRVWPSTQTSIDTIARRLCGDGPLTQPESMTVAEIRDAWLEWLRP